MKIVAIIATVVIVILVFVKVVLVTVITQTVIVQLQCQTGYIRKQPLPQKPMESKLLTAPALAAQVGLEAKVMQ